MDTAGGGWQPITAALSAVGLGDVPAWLRPYHVLSTGEKFRALLARLICEAPARAVVDEFTSGVDRQIARVGASPFAKAWRRTSRQVALLSCHYDIIDWLAPDWIFDTGSGGFQWTRGRLQCSEIRGGIYQTDWRFWPHFEQHHYLGLPGMVTAYCYVVFINDEPVTHIAMTTHTGLVEARAARLVVMPDWQGLVGRRFLNAVCALWRKGENPYGKPLRTLFHTSHPRLVASLRADPLWTQVSAHLRGDSKQRSSGSMNNSRRRRGLYQTSPGYGGHFRSIQGVRYLGSE